MPAFNPMVVNLHTQHHVLTRPEPDLLAYTLTGIAMIADGKGESQAWKQYTLPFAVDLPGLTPGKKLALVHWAPFITVSSFANDNVATNAGWAVDSFRLIGTGNAKTRIDVEVDIAIRDADGWILRLAYCINVVGREV